MKHITLALTFGLLLGGSLACSGTPDKKDVKGGATVNSKAFHKQLLDIAKKYKRSYTEMNPRPNWSPTMCRIPPTQALYSKSKETKTHGQKLYYLFASNPKDYGAYKRGAKVPQGQAIVKESWTPVEVKKGAKKTMRVPAEKDGKKYVTGKQKDLYIMLKVDPKTPDTDQGWIYGTVTADGKTVTSSGRVQSCMKCHVKIKDRLFGLK